MTVAQRKCEHCRQSGLQRFRAEAVEAFVVSQIRDRDGGAGGIALHAGPLVGVQLKELQFAGLVRRRGHHAQLSERVGEQESGRRKVNPEVRD